MFLFTDLPFDIEEIITKELDVLLAFRKSTKHFKDLIKFNKRPLKKMIKSNQNESSFIHTNPYLKMVMCGEHKRVNSPQLLPMIHGFTYISVMERNNYYNFNHNARTHRGGLNNFNATVAQLNDKLTELGAKKFKSKNRQEKINLLMSDGKFHRNYEAPRRGRRPLTH